MSCFTAIHLSPTCVRGAACAGQYHCSTMDNMHNRCNQHRGSFWCQAGSERCFKCSQQLECKEVTSVTSHPTKQTEAVSHKLSTLPDSARFSAPTDTIFGQRMDRSSRGKLAWDIVGHRGTLRELLPSANAMDTVQLRTVGVGVRMRSFSLPASACSVVNTTGKQEGSRDF